MKKSVFPVAMFAAALFANAGALAQPFPSKPIRLIAPTPPWGSGDLVLRPLAERLLPTLGQAIVLDYKPGASQIIGTDLLAKASADGYTIGFITTFYGLLAPTRTPREIVARLSQDIGRELRSSDLQEQFGALGQAPAPSTPAEFAATLRQDAEYWARMVKLTGARGE